MSLYCVDYVALADWMWYGGKYILRRVAFAPMQSPGETLVICYKGESFEGFTFSEVQKNCTVLAGFEVEPVRGRAISICAGSFESFVRGQFYHTILCTPDNREVSIGTYDMATFLLLEPLLRSKVVFLGPKVDVEEELLRQVYE